MLAHGERSVAFVGSLVNLSSASQQQLHHVLSPVPAAHGEGGDAFVVGLVHRRAVGQEHPAGDEQD